MQAQVKEWENSQDIFWDVKASNGANPSVKPLRHKTLEERAAEFDGKLMLDGEYDWGEPYEY